MLAAWSLCRRDVVRFLRQRSRIIGVHHIHDSLLGREVEVVRSGDRPKATRLMLGDHSRADLE